MSTPNSFQAVVADQLDPSHWSGLLDGNIGTLRIPRFLSEERCRSAVAELYAGPHFPPYDPIEECGGVDPVAHQQIRSDLLEGSQPGKPPVTRRLGRTLYEFAVRGRADEYFKLTPEFDGARRATFSFGGDVIDDVLRCVRLVTGSSAAIADEPGYGPCYAGVVREVHGRSRLHSDDAREETPDFVVGTLPFQLGMYVVLEMPERGGDLIVYEREYRSGDRPHRLGYGLDPIAIAGERYVGLAPRSGDLILFPDRNIHRVEPCSGSGRRIKLQAHLGVHADGTVVCWS